MKTKHTAAPSLSMPWSLFSNRAEALSNVTVGTIAFYRIHKGLNKGKLIGLTRLAEDRPVAEFLALCLPPLPPARLVCAHCMAELRQSEIDRALQLPLLDSMNADL